MPPPFDAPMNTEANDPRNIPILTDVVDKDGTAFALVDAKSVHAAVVTETLQLAESLLHRAAKDMEAILFERVFDQLRALLPELVDRVLREQADGPGAPNRPTSSHG